MTADSELLRALEHFQSEASAEGENYAQRFEKALAAVLAFKSTQAIEPLLLLLNDEAEYDELMFSIIHGVEQFDDSTYVAHLLAVLPELREKSPRWASIVVMRVLNSDSARAELTRQLRSSSKEVRESAMWLFEKINERHPAFLSKTVAPLSAVRA